jgi:hypothetical protein
MGENGEPIPFEEKLVTVASFRDLSEALLAKGRLETAGVDCVLVDDNIVRMDWFWSNLMGGVKLNVPESQAESAHELLFGEQQDSPTLEGEMRLIKCPKCGSLDVRAVDPDRGVRLAALAMVPLPLPRIGQLRWLCSDCGAKWVDDEE